MKKNLILLLFCLLAFGCSDERQELIEEYPITEPYGCGTPAPPPPAWFFEPNTRGFNNKKYYNLNIFVHVVRATAGYGFDKETVSSTIITNLNRDYADTNISFSLLGSEYIDNDDLNKLPSSLEKVLFGKNSHANAIDIYVLTSGADFKTRDGKPLAGKALAIPSTACIISRTNYRDNTVAHEMGHCLGLYHTHHGTSVGERNNACPELVNGTNSATCGDYIIDTPADPNIWHLCDYAGTITDANGEFYTPSSSNFMTYADRFCCYQFTPMQNQRMIDTIEHSYALQAAVKPWINGSDFLATSGTYSVDLADDFNVSWTVKCQSYSTQKKTYETYTKQYSGHSITIGNQNDASPSQLYTITMQATRNDINITETKKVYHVRVNSQTGQLRWSTSPIGSSSSAGQTGTINLANPLNSVVKVYQNGYLYFYYDDFLGGNSVTYPNYYNFQFTDQTIGSVFTKPTSANNMFYCPRSTPVGISSTARALLNVSINGYVNFVSFPIQVLPAVN